MKRGFKEFSQTTIATKQYRVSKQALHLRAQFRQRAHLNPAAWGLLSLVLLFFLSGCAAVENRERLFPTELDDTVPVGEKIDNDILLTGTDVVVEGEINGDLLAIGNSVTINGPVSGSVMAFGQTVEVNGDIGGSLYTLGLTLELGPNANLANNAHFAGLNLGTLRGSLVQRDLVVVALGARLAGDLGRSLNGFILLMTLNGKIGMGAEADSSTSEDAAARLPGLRLIGDRRVFIGASSANDMTGISPRAIFQRDTGRARASALEEMLPAWLFNRLTELAILLPLGLLLLWLVPSLINRPAAWLKSRPLPAVGYGLVGVIVAINVVVITILLFISLLQFGVWLGNMFSWTLVYVVWGIGFPALTLALVLFMLAILIGTKVVVADLVGTSILGWVAPDAIRYRVLPFLLGLLLYLGFRSVPTLGVVLETLVTLLGLGGMWLALQKRGEVPKGSRSGITQAALPEPDSLETEETEETPSDEPTDEEPEDNSDEASDAENEVSEEEISK